MLGNLYQQKVAEMEQEVDRIRRSLLSVQGRVGHGIVGKIRFSLASYKIKKTLSEIIGDHCYFQMITFLGEQSWSSIHSAHRDPARQRFLF